MEDDFFNGHCDDDRVFYILFTNSKRDFQFMNNEVCVSWSPNWTKANAIFEYQLDVDSSFTSYKNKMSSIWNDNRMFLAWKNYISCVHTKKYEPHVFIDSIILALQLDDIPVC